MHRDAADAPATTSRGAAMRRPVIANGAVPGGATSVAPLAAARVGRHFAACAVLLAAALGGCAGMSGNALPPPGSALAYPPTAKVDQVDTYFGTRVADPYRWLEDDNAPATREWVAAQNRLTFAQLERIPFRAALLERVRTLTNYPKYSAPFRQHGRVFFTKNDGLQNQAVLYVQDGPDGTPEVVLDPNTFSPDGTVGLQSFTLSRDGRYAAYGQTAIPGSDWVDIRVLDMRTRQPLPEVLHGVKFSAAAWRGDGFYYSRFPAPAAGSELSGQSEHHKVYFHRVGTAQEADTLAYEDPAHPRRLLFVGTTEDERFAVLHVRDPQRRGNALFVREESQAGRPFQPIVAEPGDDRFDVVDNLDGVLLALTNQGAPNGRLVRVDPLRPAPADWVEVLAERAEPIESVSSAGGRLFVTYLKDVTARVEVRAFDGSLQNTIELPGPGSTAGFSGERGDTDVFYVFTSMNQPTSIYRYDIATRRSTLFRAPSIPGFDASRYESRQVFFDSRDGTRVPMFLVHRKGLALDGSHPTVLYGYGGFNVSLGPYFSATRIAWLEQGGVFAVANLRGGGEYGEAWHEAGTRLKKQNVFDDCIAAAQYLIRSGYTSPQRLALQGGSNGGLLVGAVVNQRPDLFRVALPEVGVMDMLRFQRFSVGASWVSDYGSSDDEADFRNLLGYSPLHNIRAGADHPATLVVTADHDDRVVPAHSFKYIATLQEKAGAGAPQLIRIDTNSGHGASNLSKSLALIADVYAFTWWQMGFEPSFAR
jgi:prolyl oligopeptidase